MGCCLPAGAKTTPLAAIAIKFSDGLSGKIMLVGGGADRRRVRVSPGHMPQGCGAQRPEEPHHAYVETESGEKVHILLGRIAQTVRRQSLQGKRVTPPQTGMITFGRELPGTIGSCQEGGLSGEL